MTLFSLSRSNKRGRRASAFATQGTPPCDAAASAAAAAAILLQYIYSSSSSSSSRLYIYVIRKHLDAGARLSDNRCRVYSYIEILYVCAAAAAAAAVVENRTGFHSI